MNQKRHRGLVGPLKVIQYVQVRTCLSAARQRLGNALKKIAALLRGRQFNWLRDIRKNPSEAWSDLGQFGCIVAYPPTVDFQACGLPRWPSMISTKGRKGTGSSLSKAISA